VLRLWLPRVSALRIYVAHCSVAWFKITASSGRAAKGLSTSEASSLQEAILTACRWTQAVESRRRIPTAPSERPSMFSGSISALRSLIKFPGRWLPVFPNRELDLGRFCGHGMRQQQRRDPIVQYGQGC